MKGENIEATELSLHLSVGHWVYQYCRVHTVGAMSFFFSLTEVDIFTVYRKLYLDNYVLNMFQYFLKSEQLQMQINKVQLFTMSSSEKKEEKKGKKI